nr:MAG TPA: hypothetical protein [Caudoviricetes sp.]
MRLTTVCLNVSVQNPGHISRVIATRIAPILNRFTALAETCFYFFCFHGISPVSFSC